MRSKATVRWADWSTARLTSRAGGETLLHRSIHWVVHWVVLFACP